MAKLALTILWFLFLSASSAWANIGPLHLDGGNFQFTSSSSVSMESEDVSIVLSPYQAEVNCDFVMKNYGPETRVTLGFPQGFFEKIEFFEASVDGKKETPVYMKDMEEDSDYSGLYSWATDLPVGQESHIKVHYLVKSFHGRRFTRFQYIVDTGKFWKGNIKDAKLTVSFGKIDIRNVNDFLPESGQVTEDGRITWHMRDLNPDKSDNIRIWHTMGIYDIGYSPPILTQEMVDTIKSPESRDLLLKGKCEEYHALIEKLARHTAAEYFPEDKGEQESTYRYAKSCLIMEADKVINDFGVELEKQNDWRKSLAYYEYWESAFEVRDMYWVQRARCHKKLGQKKKALALFQRKAQIECRKIPRVDIPGILPANYDNCKGREEFCRVNIQALSQ